MTLRLDFAATSDVGRVRKDNQDSGYAGPWLLAVCDGVGGAARGDIASSTAVHELRELDHQPDPGLTDEQLLTSVEGAIEQAHRQIGALVDHDPALNGTSTTATLTLFDGDRIAVGHVGDSRAYLFRDGQVSQITHDHTFVQTLIDEGRITEEESRVHPHRNLILRALDGMREVEPDLFILRVQAGDRLLLCSDGVSGVLPNGRLADVLATGTPDFAAVELVRVSLDAGSTDNVTCVVADVVADTADASSPDDTVQVATVPHDISSAPTGEHTLDPGPATTKVRRPMVVGAAAELRRKGLLDGMSGLFRGHRMGDTGELEPIQVDDPDLPADAIATDPEELRYALHPPQRHPVIRGILVLFVVVGLVWIAAAAGWSWTQQQWFVGEQDGEVTIYRGVNTTLAGVDLYTPYQTSDLEISELADVYRTQVEEGIPQDDLAAAQQKVRDLGAEVNGGES